MSYGNVNGLHISRAIIAENLAGAELAEGIGALGTASSSDLGGTVQFLSADPSPEFGATVAQSLGSDAARRTFLRLDTGNHQGFSMYLSYVYADVDILGNPLIGTFLDEIRAPPPPWPDALLAEDGTLREFASEIEEQFLFAM